jgi:hypothetical protein
MLHPDLGYINYKYVVFRPLLVLLHVPLYDYPLKRNKIKTHHFSIFGGGKSDKAWSDGGACRPHSAVAIEGAT